MSSKIVPNLKGSPRITKTDADDAILRITLKIGSAPDETVRTPYGAGIVLARFGTEWFVYNLVSEEAYGPIPNEPFSG